MRLQTAPVQASRPQVFVANCLASDVVGDVVYITGDKAGLFYQVTKVDIDDLTKMPAAGVIIVKGSSTECIVQTAGIIAGIYTGLTPQLSLFVGTNGRLTHTVPPQPTTGPRVHQMMGIAIATTELLLDMKSPIILTT
jgi:hypothetical protein